MFNQHHMAKQIVATLQSLGVDVDELYKYTATVDLENTELLTFFLTIDNHLKLKKIMQLIDDLKTKVDVLQGQVKTNNELLTRLNGAVKDALAKLAVAGGLSSDDQAKLQAISAEVDGITIDLSNADTVNNPDAQAAADPNPATTSGTAAGSTGSASGAGSTEPPTAADAVNG